MRVLALALLVVGDGAAGMLPAQSQPPCLDAGFALRVLTRDFRGLEWEPLFLEVPLICLALKERMRPGSGLQAQDAE